MSEVYIVFDDSGYDNETEVVAVRSTEEKAEESVKDRIEERTEEYGEPKKKYAWKETGRVPGQSARWESTVGEWIAWEKHTVD